MLARALIVVPVAFWLLAFASAIELVARHRRPDRSVAWYALHGAAFFDLDNFALTGVAAHRRMLAGIAGFVLSAVGVTALLTQDQPR